MLYLNHKSIYMYMLVSISIYLHLYLYPLRKHLYLYAKNLVKSQGLTASTYRYKHLDIYANIYIYMLLIIYMLFRLTAPKGWQVCYVYWIHIKTSSVVTMISLICQEQNSNDRNLIPYNSSYFLRYLIYVGFYPHNYFEVVSI